MTNINLYFLNPANVEEINVVSDGASIFKSNTLDDETISEVHKHLADNTLIIEFKNEEMLEIKFDENGRWKAVKHNDERRGFHKRYTRRNRLPITLVYLFDGDQ